MNESAPEEFLEIPAERLSKEALHALIEEFILREGTDYGHSDKTLQQKKITLQRQLSIGQVRVVYSTLTEDTSLILSSELPPKQGQ